MAQSVDVRWGDYTQIQSEMNLLKAATSRNHYAYYHLLSGVDLPLKSQDDIHEFFRNHEGKEFIGYWDGHPHAYINRVRKYWLFTKWLRSSNKLLNLLTKVGNKATNLLASRKLDMDFKKGCNWFSITDVCARYVVAQDSFISTRFKHTLCSDEMFLQTIVWNNPVLKARIFDITDEYRGCLREIDWHRGSPYVWRSEDFDSLMSSGKLFARKFDDKVDREAIEKIQRAISLCTRPHV